MARRQHARVRPQWARVLLAAALVAGAVMVPPALVYAGMIGAAGGSQMYCLHHADDPPPGVLEDREFEGSVDFLTTEGRPLLGQLTCVYDEDGPDPWRTTVQVVPVAVWMITLTATAVAGVGRLLLRQPRG